MQLNHAKAAITMLTTAHELYKKGWQAANRLIYHIGALLAREQLACEDVQSAQRLLESVAGVQNTPHMLSEVLVRRPDLFIGCMCDQHAGPLSSPRPPPYGCLYADPICS